LTAFLALSNILSTVSSMYTHIILAFIR